MRLKVELMTISSYEQLLNEEDSEKIVNSARENKLDLLDALVEVCKKCEIYIPEWNWDLIKEESEYTAIERITQ